MGGYYTKLVRKGFKKLANILMSTKRDCLDRIFGGIRERIMSSNLRFSRYINEIWECLIIFYYVKSGILGQISRLPNGLKFLKTAFFTPPPHTQTTSLTGDLLT